MATKDARRRAIEALERDGRLTPDDLVRVAQNKEHPLHGEFEWDDTIAGHQWRIHQARQIIHSVRVTIQVDTARIVAPAYVRDPEAIGQGYVAIAQVRTESENARMVLYTELKRLESILERSQEVAKALGFSADLEGIAAPARRLIAQLAGEAGAGSH